MLSDKLLSKTDYNCDREIRTLELLKLRFGDANLHNCEVRHGALLPYTVITLSCHPGNLSMTYVNGLHIAQPRWQVEVALLQK